MRIARAVARMSELDPAVGAVIYDGRMVSGFNWEHGDRIIHAEEMALRDFDFLPGMSWPAAVMAITMAPCISCAQKIVESPVKTVLYHDDWWDKAGLDILKAKGVIACKILRSRVNKA